MYRPQRHRSTPTPSSSSTAARLAAEAAFSALPVRRPEEPASNALIVVKKKRLLDAAATHAGQPAPAHEDGAHHAPRVFRVATVDKPAQAEAGAPVDNAAEAPRRTRRPSVTRPSPVVTLVPPTSPPIDLAALQRELEAAMTAREHAAAQAQLNRLQAQLSALDAVLALIAKAREFTLSDMQLSTQWQQLTQAAGRLLDGPVAARLTPQP